MSEQYQLKIEKPEINDNDKIQIRFPTVNPDRIVPNYDPRRRSRLPSSPQIGLIVADSCSPPSRSSKTLNSFQFN